MAALCRTRRGLSKEGDGFRIAMVALDGGRIGIASQAVGVGRAALQKLPSTTAKSASSLTSRCVTSRRLQTCWQMGGMQLEAAQLLALRAAF